MCTLPVFAVLEAFLIEHVVLEEQVFLFLVLLSQIHHQFLLPTLYNTSVKNILLYFL